MEGQRFMCTVRDLKREKEKMGCPFSSISPNHQQSTQIIISFAALASFPKIGAVWDG
jgi:hypothetical protein